MNSANISVTHHWKEDLLGNSMSLYISIGSGTVDKLFDKILDNVLGSSRFHELFSRFLMDSSVHSSCTILVALHL
ncbi:hypothetical protein T12_10170 [Trichinella patagoniensis]|uniref:Uncharacterized protein n=2 Tax=Trichinella patagoniensis TaxID=990121 RepID=A0A0V0YZK8_9BILA|nr:hypothetical protein T12_10170 [Trichinella patagoniensis]